MCRPIPRKLRLWKDGISGGATLKQQFTEWPFMCRSAVKKLLAQSTLEQMVYPSFGLCAPLPVFGMHAANIRHYGQSLRRSKRLRIRKFLAL